MDRLIAYMDERRPLVEAELDRLLPRIQTEPTTLHDAMRYSVFAGGKRIRAMLALMGCRCCGGEDTQALSAAAALEMVHTYSLVHDDLPAMDNDDMRRGKLTCHKAFDEATAILAGDALLTLAFQVLADKYLPEVAAPSVLCLARAVGHRGMVGGQILDLEGEGREPTLEAVEQIHGWKTGALIRASCRLGGIIAGGDAEALKALDEYATALGMVFQITDDCLDVTASEQDLGKTPGKDAEARKMTVPAAIGLEAAQEMAKDQASEAKNALNRFGKEALMLRLLADYVVLRTT